MGNLFISAAHKSSGKTTLSIGICACLAEDGLKVRAFKKGPDYIDPMWLGSATGHACYNLDFYTMSHAEIMQRFDLYNQDMDIGVIEGNKGLFDGLDLDGSNSNAALASLLGSPVILVLDVRGMTRGIAPLILGYQAFDQKVNIAGVIFNQLGGSRHEAKLRAVVEHYTDVPVVGAVQRNTQLNLNERHLGLIPSNEFSASATKIDKIAGLIRQQVDLSKLLEISQTAVTLQKNTDSIVRSKKYNNVKIGLLRDSAFGFYYSHDIDRFKQLGVELVYIDSMQTKVLPRIDGLFIGGGFPETHLTEINQNTSLRESLLVNIKQGLPVYAECGGLMYLAKSITWQNDKQDMVGVIPADVIMEEKPQGRGYVKLKPTDAFPWPQAKSDTVSAHEFHYSRLKNLSGNHKYAYKVLRGFGIDGTNDGLLINNVMASYSHLSDGETNPWIESFLQFVQDSGVTQASNN